MFQTNILDYRSRLEVARHGFQSVTVKLAADYEQWREVLARRGIQISATRVRKVVRHFQAEQGENGPAWRRILEQTTSALLRQSAGG
jgi:NTE family protein